MDFLTEENLCKLADAVWRKVAGEPGDVQGCRERRAVGAAQAGRDVLHSLHLRDVFAIAARDMPRR